MARTRVHIVVATTALGDDSAVQEVNREKSRSYHSSEAGNKNVFEAKALFSPPVFLPLTQIMSPYFGSFLSSV